MQKKRQNIKYENNKTKNVEFKNTCALAHQHSKTPTQDLLRLPFGGFQFRTFIEGSRIGYDVFFTGRVGEGLFILVHHPLHSHVSPCFKNHLPTTSKMAAMFRPSGLFPSMFFLITYCVFILFMFFLYGCGGDEMDQICLQA